MNLPIKNGVKSGYDVAHKGDAVNLQFPNSKNRRGRVGHEKSQTLDTGCQMGVIVDD